MNAMRAFFSKFQKNERGVTAIEYGLIAIAMAALLTVVFTKSGGITDKMKTGFNSIESSISAANSATYQ
ncbi:Flp family type IVb pilin [Photobacterium carnosum]|uniref:Flp family type IVb pilin n=1 Tax=Photobacterium carnosum TaxID=2023717 RepID=UPI001C90CAC9|nr:Flp family type IVb pilin [Photobacterium carnosum]MBY3787042.1 Flp family type IVb pilin [Photobacterium carnosum]